MGGAITAALFLKQFVDTDKVRAFAHWTGLLPMLASTAARRLIHRSWGAVLSACLTSRASAGCLACWWCGPAPLHAQISSEAATHETALLAAAAGTLPVMHSGCSSCLFAGCQTCGAERLPPCKNRSWRSHTWHSLRIRLARCMGTQLLCGQCPHPFERLPPCWRWHAVLHAQSLHQLCFEVSAALTSACAHHTCTAIFCGG